jgi:hypothetical protein
VGGRASCASVMVPRCEKDDGRHAAPHHLDCFLKGTRILTLCGERAVQELRIDEEVQTLNGPKPIKWIGYNKFWKAEGAPWHGRIKPIRVARFAIDDRTPHRDLYVSPEHCLFLDGVLIPVIYLVNNTTVGPNMPSDLDTIEYYHVEFDTHEVIYAEGVCVESFGGGLVREDFSNFRQYYRLYGRDCRFNTTPFAPIIGHHGRPPEMKGLVRTLMSRFVDVRDPAQVAHDRIAERAGSLLV